MSSCCCIYLSVVRPLFLLRVLLLCSVTRVYSTCVDHIGTRWRYIHQPGSTSAFAIVVDCLWMKDSYVTVDGPNAWDMVLSLYGVSFLLLVTLYDVVVYILANWEFDWWVGWPVAGCLIVWSTGWLVVCLSGRLDACLIGCHLVSVSLFRSLPVIPSCDGRRTTITASVQLSNVRHPSVFCLHHR